LTQRETITMNDQTNDMLSTLTPDRVSDAIKQAGCAVTALEQDGTVHLHSASHGVGFQVLWGTAVELGRYADLTLSCPLRVQGGSLPDALLAEWHRTKRFARLAQHGEFLALEMDVVASGGVSEAHLMLQMRLWTQMMGEFFLFLRNYRTGDVQEQARVQESGQTAEMREEASPSAIAP
jgi:hypothetical protein